MTFFLIKFLSKAFAILNGEESPNEIAAGIAFGVMLGLVPTSGLLPIIITLIAWIININLTAFAFSAGLFKLISYLLDPVSNRVGFYFLVKIPALKGFWTALYNKPLIPFTNFNNTIVMGSLIIGFVLLVPVFFLAKAGLLHYRAHLKEKVLKFKIVQTLKASTFYRYYENFKQVRGQ